MTLQFLFLLLLIIGVPCATFFVWRQRVQAARRMLGSPGNTPAAGSKRWLGVLGIAAVIVIAIYSAFGGNIMTIVRQFSPEITVSKRTTVDVKRFAPANRRTGTTTPVFSPDGTRVAFISVADDDGSVAVVIDGERHPLTGGTNGTFSFTADSELMAYVEHQFENYKNCCWRLVSKPRASATFTTSNVFPTEQDALAQLAETVGPENVVTELQRAKRLRRSAVSPDGSLMATAAVTKTCAMTVGRPCTDSVTVNNSSQETLYKRTYDAEQNKDPNIRDLVFSPNSRTLAYSVGSSTAENGWARGGGYVMVGQTQGPVYDAIVLGTLRFNADGTQIQYGAIQDREILWITETVPPEAMILSAES